jgi:hypothetical protein
MRDGRILSDQPVLSRLTAAEELARVREEQRAIQLAP